MLFLVDVLETEAKELLKEAFVQVREAATNDPGKKLFPNGIDLIYVRLEGGSGAAKVAVELKLAGPVKADG